MECDYGSKCGDERQKAVAFAEFDGIVDSDYTAETGNEYYGWWGCVCQDCLEEIKELIKKHENGVLRYLPAEEVPPIPIKESTWHDHKPDWSKATVVGFGEKARG